MQFSSTVRCSTRFVASFNLCLQLTYNGPHTNFRIIRSESMSIIYLYPYFCVFLLSSSCSSPDLLPSAALSHATFDFHTSLTFFMSDTCFQSNTETSSLVSWSQICLLISIAVFETVRFYKKKTTTTTPM